MKPPPFVVDSLRRRLLAGAVAGLAVPLLARSAAAALLPTPGQTPGPFYPRSLPEDHDADLVRVDGRAARALGEETWIEGRVSDTGGVALRDAVVEIWQCDANGRYHHHYDRRDVPLDVGFQGFGRVRVDGEGRYRFRTIRPVPYPGRTPHIHFRVVSAEAGLVTQMYVRGEPLNARDGVLRSVRDPAARERLMVDFANRGGVLHGRFDLVLARG